MSHFFSFLILSIEKLLVLVFEIVTVGASQSHVNPRLKIYDFETKSLSSEILILLFINLFKLLL